MKQDQFHKSFFESLAERNNRIAADIEKVYQHKNERMPVVYYNMNYWLDGENPALIPDNYFDDPAIMTQYQVDKMKSHIEAFDDDFIPFLFPWYGTAVVPSAFGGKIVFHPKQDPSLDGYVINSVEEIKSLKKPDPYKDGLMPKVLRTIDFMRENTNLPISVTDPQGPLNIALSLAGVENLFIWMCTNPEETHQLMNFCSEVLIDWITVQKKHAGQELYSGAWPHGLLLPKGFGGVWIADDDCTQLSEDMYKEFVVPYNSKVLKAFGGGTIHFCGSAKHQIDNMLQTEGLTGINNFSMGDFEQIALMQEKFEDKIALMVCDFSPLKIDEFYDELFAQLKPKGTILASYASYGYGLQNGKYEITNRDSFQLGKDVENVVLEMKKKQLEKIL